VYYNFPSLHKPLSIVSVLVFGGKKMLSPYSLPLSIELILSTSEVQALTGAKPKGEEWARGAFLFVGEGKIGDGFGWPVVRKRG
jgi:hypothetical protein